MYGQSIKMLKKRLVVIVPLLLLGVVSEGTNERSWPVTNNIGEISWPSALGEKSEFIWPINGPIQTLFDEFAIDADDWDGRNGQTCGFNSGQLTLSAATGVCHYSGSDHGTQPTDRNQWAIVEIGSFAEQHTGVGLRHSNVTATTAEFNYVVRCSASLVTIRVCDSDADCLTIADLGACTNLNGDQLALMVAGENDNTELCGWYWAAAETDPSFENPSLWNDPEFCVTENGTIDLLTDFVGSATIEDWDTAGGCAPDECTDKDFPAVAQKDVTVYSGTTNASSMNQFGAGNLGL